MIDKTVFHRLAAEPDIFRHRHMRHQIQLLVDHRDPGAQRVHRILKLDRLPFNANRALIGTVDPDQAFHQRGFSGAVFAHQRVHRPRAHA